MDRQLRPLLPAEGSSSASASANETSNTSTSTGTSSQSVPTISTHSGNVIVRPKRSLVVVACDDCRRKKTKCDGQRPSCGRCVANGLHCEYEVEETAVSRVAALKNRNALLQRENDQLKELYSFLHLRPETEAREIFHRIRTSNDPFSVLRFVNQGDLLLNPISPANAIREVELLNRNAFQSSYYTVPSRPWTAVAGDGLVSALITSFFKWDEPFFYPFLDQECFLEDMRGRDIQNAKFCSPFLVNAVCAARCFTSETAKKIGAITSKNLTIQFLEEAKRLLELESGRESLPTVQGLALIFTVSTYLGLDRAGSVYRYTLYEMLKRMELEKKFSKLRDDIPAEMRERKAISKALWGLFCFESLVAFVYLQQSFLRPPAIARFFKTTALNWMQDDSDQLPNIDIAGNPFISTSEQPPLVPGVLNASCELSLILFKIMEHNHEETMMLGSKEDMIDRVSFYEELLSMVASLPPRLQVQINPTPQTCFLRVYSSIVAFSILRPLEVDLLFGREEAAVKDLLIKHCTYSIEALERYAQIWTLTEYSCMCVYGLYSAAWTLVTFLDDPSIFDIFTRACLMLRHTSRDFPMARYLLQGLLALAWALKQSIPAQAGHCFEDLGTGKEELKDVPVAFIVPQHKQVQEMLGEDDQSQMIVSQIGTLLSKWAEFSLS